MVTVVPSISLLSVRIPASYACTSRTSFFFSSRRRHTRSDRDWSSDVCSSDLGLRSCRARVCCPPHIIAAPSSPIYVGHAGFSILGKKYRSVEVDDIAQLSEHERRSHCKTGSDHIADHDLEPQAARLVRHRETFGQPAALIELDIYHVEASRETRQVAEAERAFIRRDRDRRAESLEIRFPAALQRLFQQRNLRRCQPADQRIKRLDAVALIGVHPH